jgi:polysaccharide pyruvyl transferase WcaK-like protein
LTNAKIHFIHVANMNNKGTQALVSSDVSVINEIVTNPSVTLSTTDVNGVKKLNLKVKKVLPPVVDLPFDKADQLAERFGFRRGGVSYKILMVAMFILMAVQTVILFFSIVLRKAGFKAFYRSEVIECIRNSDLVISHSDENFKETTSLLPLNIYWVLTYWSMMASRTLDVMVARFFNRPVIMFPNSLGPFRTLVGRFLSKLSLKSCDFLLIRDPVSFEIVRNLKIETTKILTYDTALLFNQNEERNIQIPSKPLVGVSAGIYSHSLSKHEVENYIAAHAKALDAAIEKHGFFILFLPHYVGGFANDDLYVSKQILERMRNKSHTRLILAKNVSEFKQYLNQVDMVISSKMHPAILASSGYVPTLCIAYDHKQTAFFQNLGMLDFVLNIRQLSYEELLSKITSVWRNKTLIEKKLRKEIPKWQRNIRMNIEKVVDYYFDDVERDTID